MMLRLVVPFVALSLGSALLNSVEFLSFGVGVGDLTLNGDDLISPALETPFTMEIQETIIKSLYVSVNGYISLNKGIKKYGISLSDDVDIITPMAFDFDCSENSSKLLYQVYDASLATSSTASSTNSALQNISRLIHKYTSSSDFEAVWVLVTTWENAQEWKGSANEAMTFQCVVVTNGEATFTMFNYKASTFSTTKSTRPVIGVKVGNYVKHNLYSKTTAALQMHQRTGNVGKRGFYVYRLSKHKATGENPSAICAKWYLSELPNMQGYLNRLGNSQCPCSWKIGRGLRRNRYVSYPYFNDCYFVKIGVSGLECCYNQNRLVRQSPGMGSYVTARSNSFTEYINNNWKYKRYCCELSNLCSLYYAVRPSANSCSRRTRRRSSRFFGDPHIKTLDGKQYTFNGYGEYILVMGNSTDNTSSIEIQTRTVLALDKENKTVNATVFGAFAGQDQDGMNFQVQLNSDREKMIIYGNQEDFSVRFYNDVNFTVDVGTMEFQRKDDSLEILMDSEVMLTFTVTQRMLDLAVEIPDEFEEQLRGLLGNFNGNMYDDFTLPDGTVLDTSISNYTERQIYYGFGDQWSLTNTGRKSLFQYPAGNSASHFSFPYFVPKFVDEFSKDAYDKATATCSKNRQTAALSCVFDLLLTKDEGVASSSGNIDRAADEEREILANEVPSLSGPTQVIFTYNETKTVKYSASDDGTVVIGVPLRPSSGFSVDNSTDGEVNLTWTPTSENPEQIRLTVIDNNNVEGPAIDVEILFCNGCHGNGNCSKETRNNNITSFNLLKCICNTGWAGDDCKHDFDACAALPCAQGQNCTDFTPSEEEIAGYGYNCTACPKGFVVEGRKCHDINECSSNTTNNCEQNCTNTQGSYTCRCNDRYRIQDGYKCNDINECDEGTSGCQQKCVNTEGSYMCGCVYGYELLPDGKTCNQTLDICEINNLTCSYACDNSTGSYHCICKAGFELMHDGANCTDIDECNGNICSQQCNNTIGSYLCSCYPGYTLNQDKVTCESCPDLKWGPNCGNTCSCDEDGTASCDKATGCVCNTGYTGQDCSQDINECVVTPYICGSDKLCRNARGSYYCYCPTGFNLINERCVDINECADASTNNCSITRSDCVNVDGGYTCKCKSGYNQNGLFNCDDINECSDGSTECDQKCINNIGSYSCDCNPGFELNGDRTTCTKLSDPCKSISNLTCGYACNLENGQDKCYCPKGFGLGNDKQTCYNINECNNATLNTCSQTCTDTEGGYTCSCSTGYKLDNDQRTCTVCDQYHWGDSCSSRCNCGLGAKECNNIRGCVCKSGWAGDNCDVDIDECLQSPCSGSNEKCINSPGSYVCRCKTGYTNNTGSCEDINECLDSSVNGCSHDCENMIGSFVCKCKDGFILNSATHCEDINECTTGKSNCDQTCYNTIGSYICSCKEGFILNITNRQSCYAKMECSANNTCSDICFINSTLHEECACPSGYELVYGVNCTNINECLKSPCSQICTDTTPGYTCSCNDGFYLQDDSVNCKECTEGTYGSNCNNTCECIPDNTKSCNAVNGECTCNTGWNGTKCEIDIDECTSGVANCQNYSTCRNTNGSYICDCEAGYVSTNPSTCTPCSSTQYGKYCAETCKCVLENTVECNKVNGNCTCKQGWNGTICSDGINECYNNPCSANQDCTNTNGSYSCNCKTGYVLNTTSSSHCIDLNECLIDSNNNCDVNAVCENTVGGYNCTCKAGYEGDGQTCHLITTTTELITSTTEAATIEIVATTEVDKVTDATLDSITTTATTERLTTTDEVHVPDKTTQTGTTTVTPLTTRITTASSAATTFKDTETTTTERKTNTADATPSIADAVTTTTYRETIITEAVTITSETETSTTVTVTTTEPTSTALGTVTSRTEAINTATVAATTTTEAAITTTETTTKAANEYIYTMVVTLDIDLSDKFNLSIPGEKDILNRKVQTMLYNTYKDIEGLIKVLINRISFGSLIVDHKIVTTENSAAKQGVAKTLTEIAQGTKKYNFIGTNVDVKSLNYKFGGKTVNVDKSTTMCQLLGEDCQNPKVCQIIENFASCRSPATSDNFELIIGLGVGIPLSVLLIFTIIVIFVYVQNVKRTEGNNSERDRTRREAGTFVLDEIPKFKTRDRTAYSPGSLGEVDSQISDDIYDRII